MRTSRRHRITTGLSAALVACLAATAFAGPVAAAPDPDKAAQRAERKAEHQASKAEQKATRNAAKTERKTEREAAKAARKVAWEAGKAERVELREQRKAELETRKADAKALRAEARAAITALRDGFSEMSVEERKATLDEIGGVRDGYQVLFLALMGSWRADRQELLPNTLSDDPDAGVEAETDTETETEVKLEGDEEPAGA
jgi:hypothetical protein